MYTGLHLSTPYSSRILTKLESSQQIFEKYFSIKFLENPSSGSRVVPCGRTDITKLIVGCRNFANAHFTGNEGCYSRNVTAIMHQDVRRRGVQTSGVRLAFDTP